LRLPSYLRQSLSWLRNRSGSKRQRPSSVESRRGDKRRPRQHLELLEPRILPRPTWGLSAGLSGYLTGAETMIESKGFNTDLSLVAHWRHDRRDDRGCTEYRAWQCVGHAASSLWCPHCRSGQQILACDAIILNRLRWQRRATTSAVACDANSAT
jgi:hypothetical protein